MMASLNKRCYNNWFSLRIKIKKRSFRSWQELDRVHMLKYFEEGLIKGLLTEMLAGYSKTAKDVIS